MSDISQGYSDLHFSFCSSKTNVSYFVDYTLDNLDEKWEFVKKYAEEFEINTGVLDISIMFGASIDQYKKEITSFFEEVMKKNGTKITEYLYPKVEEMRKKIVDTIEGTIKYLESDECVEAFLTDYPDEYEFDENGNKLAEQQIA